MLIYIVSGFLGAGKTTLIKKILQEEVFKEKTLIIENELGEIGIDGELLKIQGLQVKEIYSGCICCTLQGDLVETIEEVEETFQPKRILIEPSGVARLSLILRDLKKAGIGEIDGVMTVVDPLKFKLYRRNFTDFYEDQIREASTILLSRTQMMKRGPIEEITKALSSINSRASIITTPFEELPIKKVLREARRESWEDLLEDMPSQNLSFQVWGMEIEKSYTKEQLLAILRAFDENRRYGTIIRAKGIVQGEKGWFKLDYSSGEKRLTLLEDAQCGRICVIGEDLKKELLTSLFTKG